MPEENLQIRRQLLENCMSWFLPEFNKLVVWPLQSQFPNYALPTEIREVVGTIKTIADLIKGHERENIEIKPFVEIQLDSRSEMAPLFKQVVLLYRRCEAAYAEGLLGKTFHLELTGTVKEEVVVLDELCEQDWFQAIKAARLPKLKDYLSVQFVEESRRSPLRCSPGDLQHFLRREGSSRNR